MEDNYSKAYKEVVEILKYLPEENVNKIPKELIDTLNSQMDINYNFKVDLEKSFENQKILDETKAIFAIIFRDYWATSQQKERIKAKENYDRQIEEEEKRNKYNQYDMFKNKLSSYENRISMQATNNLPIKRKKDNFFNKILTFLKKLLQT